MELQDFRKITIPQENGVPFAICRNLKECREKGRGFVEQCLKKRIETQAKPIVWEREESSKRAFEKEIDDDGLECAAATLAAFDLIEKYPDVDFEIDDRGNLVGEGAKYREEFEKMRESYLQDAEREIEQV